jgi:hypothetical protein
LKSKIETKLDQHQFSSSKYDSDGGKLKDNIKSYIYNKDKKASPSPKPPSSSPSPSPGPVIKDAYAFTPTTDAYPIPADKGKYNPSDFTTSPAPGSSPKVPIVYDYQTGDTVKTIYHPYTPKVSNAYGSLTFPPMQCAGGCMHT